MHNHAPSVYQLDTGMITSGATGNTTNGSLIKQWCDIQEKPPVRCLCPIPPSFDL